MVQMKTWDCVMTVLWSNHIRHHKIFRSGRHRRPPGRGMSRLWLARCHRKGHTRVTGGPTMVSTDIRHLRAPTRSEQSTGIKTPEVEWCRELRGCWPFICSRSQSRSSYPEVIAINHRGVGVTRRLCHVSRVVTRLVTRSRISVITHPQVQTFQVNSLLSTLFRLWGSICVPLYCNAVCELIAPDTMISLIWCWY